MRGILTKLPEAAQKGEIFRDTKPGHLPPALESAGIGRRRALTSAAQRAHGSHHHGCPMPPPWGLKQQWHHCQEWSCQSSLKGFSSAWAVPTDWSWAGDTIAAKKGRKPHGTTNIDNPHSAQNPLDYVASKAGYLMRAGLLYVMICSTSVSWSLGSLYIHRLCETVSVWVCDRLWQPHLLWDIFVEYQLFSAILFTQWASQK